MSRRRETKAEWEARIEREDNEAAERASIERARRERIMEAARNVNPNPPWNNFYNSLADFAEVIIEIAKEEMR